MTRATSASAARQCTAWLSPTSAKLTRARVAGSPNAHTCGPVRAGISEHGALGVIGASLGVGTTEKRSFGLWQGCTGSRAAAPKQRGAAADSPAATASATTRPARTKRANGQMFCW